MKTYTITIEDYHKATGVPWSPNTCIIQQTSERLDLPSYLGLNATTLVMHPDVMEVYRTFDDAYSPTRGSVEKLEAFKAKLPITVTI